MLIILLYGLRFFVILAFWGTFAVRGQGFIWVCAVCLNMISCKPVELKLFADDFERYEAFCRKERVSLLDGVARLMDIADVPSAEEIKADIERDAKMRKKGLMDMANLLSRAEAGDCSAQSVLAGMYFAGDGVAQNSSRAAFWAEKAASAGECSAELLLGVMYCLGDGVPQDFAKARVFLSDALEYGSPHFMMLAGLSCLGCAFAADGVPVPDEPVLQEAFSWFLRSAELRNAYGEFLLGFCYLFGIGVVADDELASAWMGRGMFRSGEERLWVFGGMAFQMKSGEEDVSVPEYFRYLMVDVFGIGEKKRERKRRIRRGKRF